MIMSLWYFFVMWRQRRLLRKSREFGERYTHRIHRRGDVCSYLVWDDYKCEYIAQKVLEESYPQERVFWVPLYTQEEWDNKVREEYKQLIEDEGDDEHA